MHTLKLASLLWISARIYLRQFTCIYYQLNRSSWLRYCLYHAGRWSGEAIQVSNDVKAPLFQVHLRAHFHFCSDTTAMITSTLWHSPTPTWTDASISGTPSPSQRWSTYRQTRHSLSLIPSYQWKKRGRRVWSQEICTLRNFRGANLICRETSMVWLRCVCILSNDPASRADTTLYASAEASQSTVVAVSPLKVATYSLC